ncbi:MAG: WecB/TagA/CpsF family glycosyltransferase [Lachnospiraceae bacterium]|nr:WecB/TagA/CpsF family glycosyltransferase [Lachnospiraceae bacterium]
MKNVNLLGIKLKDRYVKESLTLTDKFLREGAAHTILYLTAPVLMEAVKNEDEKAWIESADLTLWGDTEILKAADVTAKARYREVQEKEFMKALLYRVAQDHLPVLVLSDTHEHTEELKKELLEIQDGITIARTVAISEMEEKHDDIINEINLIAPTIIFMRMSFSLQQKWLARSRRYINTEIWVGLPENFRCTWKREMPTAKIGKRLLNLWFNRRVNKYKK